MTPGDRHKDFNEADFDQVSDAYQRLPADEPPELLDQAVLNRARRAVASKTIRPWTFGWIHAVSTAAVLVLGIALVMNIPDSSLRESPPVSPKSVDEAAPAAVSNDYLQELPVDGGAAKTLRANNTAAPLPAETVAEPTIAIDELRLRTEPAASGLSQLERSGRADAGDGVTVLAEEDVQDLDAPIEAAEARVREPEPWLEYLLELRAQGEQELFEAELAAFRQAWPDYPLPPEFAD